MRGNKTMTQTRTEVRPPASAGMAMGQAVWQAEAVLTRLLAGVLAETGTAREAYLALQRLSAHGDAIGREGYVRDLSDWLDLDLWSAGELADRLVASGLLTLTDGTIRLAAAGSELRARIRHLIGDVTAPLYAKLDQADIETTVRTLRDLTMLARTMASGAVQWGAVPSGAAASGANGER
jgi:DNA-binding MarR family transcriptional regulator